jgi:hypothetical protein
VRARGVQPALQGGRRGRVVSGIGAVLMTAAPAFAQLAFAQTAEPTIEALQKQLRARDALIENLVRRVEKLERQARTGIPATGNQPATRAVARSGPGASSPEPTEVALHPEVGPPLPMTAQAAPPPTPAPQAPAAASPPAPGQFEVSEEAAERALERTLVATGNLVVPQGFAEVEPLFSYTRREAPTQIFFNVNRNELFPAVDVRVGLPWESQVEMLLPWNFNEQQVTNVTVAPPQSVSNRWGNAVGDLTIGGAKTILHESGWVPGLLGRVSYEIPTGPQFANGVPLVSGQDRLSFSLTALRRQDPLVFVGTGGYTKAFTTNRINPGDQANFTFGAFLATSPETTLRGVLQENFLQNVSVNGVTFRGSDSVQSILSFGASSILGRGALVDLQAGIGLTNTSPKYTVILSSTWRFGVSGQ